MATVMHHRLHEATKKLDAIKKALPSEMTLTTWKPGARAFAEKIRAILEE